MSNNDGQLASGDVGSTPYPGATRAFIDMWIEILQEWIRALRSKRNGLAPISKVPPEVLSSIFKHVTHPTPDFGSFHSGRGRGSGLDTTLTQNVKWGEILNILHVCQEWRRVALDCPDLWSRPVFSCSELVLEMMLSLSKAYPLSIRISEAHSFMRNISPRVSQLLNVGRMEELHVKLPQEFLEKVLGSFSGSSASQLRSLLISSDGEQRISLIPRRTLSMPMPGLQHLTIADCSIQWRLIPSCLSHELISLKLSRVSGPSRNQFYDLLSHSPKLEELYLDSTFVVPSSDTLDTFRAVPVNLPKLLSCTILNSPISSCVDFHADVSYPIANAQTYFFPSASDDNDYRAALSLISSCAHHTPDPKLSIHITSFGPTISLWSKPSHAATEHLAYERVIDPRVKIEMTNLTRSQLHLESFVNLFTISGLRMVSIAGSASDVSSDAWFKFFKRHPSITEARIWSNETISIFSALCTSAREESVTAASEGGGDTDSGLEPQSRLLDNSTPDEDDYDIDFTLCLPNLSTLTLEGHGEGLTIEYHNTELDWIAEFLHKCRQYGQGIARLNIYLCHYIDKSDVELFKQDVGEVVWDGIRLSDYNSSDDDDDDDSEDDSEEEEYVCGCESCG